VGNFLTITEMKIFISSVQKEIAAERKASAAYLAGDSLLRRFFETFLFERDVPDSDRQPDVVYLSKYIERMGTGTRDMIRKCRAAGLPEPEFTLTNSFVTTIRKPLAAGKTPEQDPAAGQVAGQVTGLLMSIGEGAWSKKELMDSLNLKGRDNFEKLYLTPALGSKLIEMTIPDKPNSRLQKYQITGKGRVLLAQIRNAGERK
jgi:ATP-dependent DNA helicase RecG